MLILHHLAFGLRKNQVWKKRCQWNSPRRLSKSALRNLQYNASTLGQGSQSFRGPFWSGDLDHWLLKKRNFLWKRRGDLEICRMPSKPPHTQLHSQFVEERKSCDCWRKLPVHVKLLLVHWCPAVVVGYSWAHVGFQKKTGLKTTSWGSLILWPATSHVAYWHTVGRMVNHQNKEKKKRPYFPWNTG